MKERNDYWMRERECEISFASCEPCFMITTQQQDWLMYKSREEFIAGTNITAVAAGLSGFAILDDVQMNNHHHILGAGTQNQVESFVRIFSDKMRRFQNTVGNGSLRNWKIRIDETSDLQQVRNRTAYIDRNPYVVRLDSTPSGYPWSSAGLFFNGNLWMMVKGDAFNSLSVDMRRTICRSKTIDLPDSYRVFQGMILRSSFVDYHRTESMFNSANQYFSLLYRRGEADVEIARMLGEGIQLPNEDVFQTVSGWFKGKKIKDLSLQERLDAARKMKTELACANKQIAQILRLTTEAVDKMFPRAQ